ncbi:MAG TPA: ABC transporter, partial [Micromonosporaceae bacterium]|nr:ABC transporter [Micromonosporaceae bacterium]
PTAAQRAAAGLAVRGVADRAGASLPAPWQAAVAMASRSRLGDLPDALDRAIASTDLGMRRRPIWWRLVGSLQWLLTLTAIVGLCWLVGGYILRALGLPDPDYPLVGETPLPTVLLLGGLLAGLLLAGLVKPVVGWAARRARRRAERRLRAAVEEVGRAQVIAPVDEVLHSYGRARQTLAAAAGR